MPTRSQIVDYAREWIGTPYRIQGRAVGVATDCAGILCGVADRIGLKYSDNLRYSRFPETFNLRPELDKHLVPVPTDQMQPGDVLLMRIDVMPQHVAITGRYKTGGLSMIHAYQRAGKVVEHRLANVWRARIMQVYQIPGIEGAS